MSPWLNALLYAGFAALMTLVVAGLAALSIKIEERFGTGALVKFLIAGVLLFMGVVGYFAA